MIYIEEIKKGNWRMSNIQVKALAKELNYIADEANDHGHPYPSTSIVDMHANNITITAVPDSFAEKSETLGDNTNG